MEILTTDRNLRRLEGGTTIFALPHIEGDMRERDLDTQFIKYPLSLHWRFVKWSGVYFSAGEVELEGGALPGFAIHMHETVVLL